MTDARDREVPVYISDIRHLFSTPEIDPFAGETIDLSGVDQALDVLKSRPRDAAEAERLVIHLPAEDITPELAEKAKAALVGYCRTQIRVSAMKKREMILLARRSLPVGLLFWGACLTLSLATEKALSDHSMLGRLFGEGFLIAGWVGLWRPAELILYDWMPYAREMKLYNHLARMELTIVPLTGTGTGSR